MNVKHAETSVAATLTEQVLERLETTPDPRVKYIMQSLVAHLHDFVRKVNLSEEEWAQGIDFLTRTGQMCNERRQEFILLSDTLGISMLVDAINHQRGGAATENTVFGPFHVEGSPQLPYGADIRFGVEGELTFVHGKVLSADGQPVAHAQMEVWQVRPDRLYDVQDAQAPHMQLRATFHTREDGSYAFWTVKPVSYPIPADGPVGDMLNACGRHPWRPAHIHFRIRADGYQTLVTHLFAAGDAWLQSDAVFGVKDSLIVAFNPGTAIHPDTHETAALEVEYDFVLAPQMS